MTGGNVTKQAAIYTKSGCQECERIKQLLKSQDIDFREYTLDTHFDKTQFEMEFGGDASFPQITIGSEHIGTLKEALRHLTNFS